MPCLTENCEGTEFYASNKSYCRECIKARARKNRADNVEVRREYDKVRNATPERRARRVEFNRREDQQPKRKARYAVSNAIRDGRLVRPSTCSICNVECTPHAHHEDYDNPLEVVWMCKDCHLIDHHD